jgi:hypothetical protein
MDLFQAGDILRQHLVASSASLPIVFPNQDFPKVSTHPRGFLYVQVIGTDGEQTTLNVPGEREFRDSGMLSIHVMVPRVSKVGDAEIVSRSVRSMFSPENWAGTNLHIRNRRIGAGFVAGVDSAWWGVPVTIEFVVDRKE